MTNFSFIKILKTLFAKHIKSVIFLILRKIGTKNSEE